MLQALTHVGSNWASFGNVCQDMNSYLKVMFKTWFKTIFQSPILWFDKIRMSSRPSNNVICVARVKGETKTSGVVMVTRWRRSCLWWGHYQNLRFLKFYKMWREEEEVLPFRHWPFDSGGDGSGYPLIGNISVQPQFLLSGYPWKRRDTGEPGFAWIQRK